MPIRKGTPHGRTGTAEGGDGRAAGVGCRLQRAGGPGAALGLGGRGWGRPAAPQVHAGRGQRLDPPPGRRGGRRARHHPRAALRGPLGRDGGCSGDVGQHRAWAPAGGVSVARRGGTSAVADVAIVALGTLGGAVSQAKAVNRWGHVVGTSRDRQGRSRGFVWTPERGIVDLEPCAGVSSSANDVNDLGDVVGGGDTGFRAFHAYLLSDGTAVDLGTLGGEESEALALNGLGQIAGHSRLGGGGGKHAFFIAEPGRMLDLGTLGGGTSVAHAVSDRGAVVGRAGPTTGAPRAFRWTVEAGKPCPRPLAASRSTAPR